MTSIDASELAGSRPVDVVQSNCSDDTTQSHPSPVAPWIGSAAGAVPRTDTTPLVGSTPTFETTKDSTPGVDTSISVASSGPDSDRSLGARTGTSSSALLLSNRPSSTNPRLAKKTSEPPAAESAVGVKRTVSSGRPVPAGTGPACWHRTSSNSRAHVQPGPSTASPSTSDEERVTSTGSGNVVVPTLRTSSPTVAGEPTIATSGAVPQLTARSSGAVAGTSASARLFAVALSTLLLTTACNKTVPDPIGGTVPSTVIAGRVAGPAAAPALRRHCSSSNVPGEQTQPVPLPVQPAGLVMLTTMSSSIATPRFWTVIVAAAEAPTTHGGVSGATERVRSARDASGVDSKSISGSLPSAEAVATREMESSDCASATTTVAVTGGSEALVASGPGCSQSQNDGSNPGRQDHPVPEASVMLAPKANPTLSESETGPSIASAPVFATVTSYVPGSS